eukprot:TRINITY_DN2491_c0_g1_i1.p1 TRINITY_DN2491_c0_g1~~TRINITY_DN2491_c0_g1_i1.p1  ORF type:complete len:264 (+),score=58.14 TRINITY_DN2491_c0_g1_i1:321-1112(+)
MAEKKENEFLMALQDDFNQGQPFDISLYADKLSVLVGVMGFDKDSALEALVVTSQAGNVDLESLDPEIAVQYVLSDANAKRTQREQAKLNAGKHLMTFGESVDLIRQIQALRNKLRKEWLERMKLEMRKLDDDSTKKKDCYEGYLRGITANRMLTEKEVEAIEEYKVQNGITQEEHLECLAKIGINTAGFEKMKEIGRNEAKSPTKKIRDCHNCWDNPKMYISLQCMHVSLCEPCAEVHNAKKTRIPCPVCKRHTDEFHRVYL